ncbi:MAG: sensor histidine kinase [Usitatibacter sp.]
MNRTLSAELAAHLQSVREEERTHIAREIHDELGQALTGLKFDIGAMAESFQSGGPQAVSDATKACSLQIDRIISSVRRIASGLRPEVLDEIGLSAAIEWHGREFSRRTGIRCNVEIAQGFADPDKERSTALFRIFQELLTNVARHADATRVMVRMSDGDALRLKVEDNGRGIQQQQFEEARSLGFLGLRERVQAFGGSIDVRGQEGKGTTVAISIPALAQPPAYQ